MRPCSLPASVVAEALLDLVEPEHRRRHVFQHAAGLHENALRLAVAAGEDLDHVDAVEGELESGGDGLDAQALAAAGHAHQQKGLGHDFAGKRVAHLEQLAALQQPFLETFQAAHFFQARAQVNVFDDAAAVHQQALLFEQSGQRFRAERHAGGQGAAQRVAGFIQGEALEGAGHLLEIGIAGLGLRGTRRE